MNQSLLQAQMRVARSQSDADLARRHGSDVDLKARSPVNLDAIGPGLRLVVAPEAKARKRTRQGVQPGPFSDAGVLSVGADNPAAADDLTADSHAIARYPPDGRAPQKGSAGGGRAIH